MAWTAPMTAVSGGPFSASQFNTFVRDNVAELGVAKARTPGGYIVGNGLNSVIQRTWDSAAIPAGSTTTGTSYGNCIDQVGPSVTLGTGTVAMIWVSCNSWNSAGNAAWFTFEVSGVTSFLASDSFAVQGQGTDGDRFGAGFLFDTLTAGTNTFTGKYRVSTSGTGFFSARRITVWPF